MRQYYYKGSFRIKPLNRYIFLKNHGRLYWHLSGIYVGSFNINKVRRMQMNYPLSIYLDRVYEKGFEGSFSMNIRFVKRRFTSLNINKVFVKHEVCNIWTIIPLSLLENFQKNTFLFSRNLRFFLDRRWLSKSRLFP